MSVARRVAEEREAECGKEIGYKVRFEDRWVEPRVDPVEASVVKRRQPSIPPNKDVS